MKKMIKLWLPVLVWAAVIFLFSSFPTTKTFEIDWQDFAIKKTAHIIEYATFAFFLYRAFRGSGIEKGMAGIYTIMFVIFYGSTDEFHQSFVPGREPKMRDIVFDTIGGAFAIFLIWRVLPKTPTKLRALAAKWGLL